MSIEETNKIRAALGMKLLPVANRISNLEFKSPASTAQDTEQDLGSTLETRQAASYDNWKKVQDEADEKRRREQRREALKKERDAAQRFAKIEGKGLADEADDDMDTRGWLISGKKRQKKIEKERARILQKELEERENQVQYTEKDLAGKRVGHELGSFEDGDQILTLRDAAVDGEDDEDELENVELREHEKRKERQELKKKKPVYDPNEVDEMGEKKLLSQYDEEIDGKKRKKFTLGDSSSFSNTVPGEGSGSSRGVKFSLDFEIEDKPISDYVEPSEIKIRKPKNKKDKSKKKQRAVDDDDVRATNVLVDPHPASLPDSMELDVTQPLNVVNHAAKRTYDNAAFGDDDDLQSSLALQRRTALKKRKIARPEDLARQMRKEAFTTPTIVEADDLEEEGGLIIDETSEFVANLQRPKVPEVKTAPIKQKVDHSPKIVPKVEDEDMDDVESVAQEALQEHLTQQTGDAGEGDISTTGLEEEGSLERGIGSVLNLLHQRGIVKTGDSGDLNAIHRERQHFLAEKQKREGEAERRARTQRERDRASGKFDRMSAREREQHAQWENKQRDQQDSRHIAEAFNRDYKPNVELKYVDSAGRSMNQKEAFKELSHQFHGKGSGKLKTEKRLKKIEDEKKREAMSSLDNSQSTGMNNAAGATARKNRQAGVRLQ